MISSPSSKAQTSGIREGLTSSSPTLEQAYLTLALPPERLAKLLERKATRQRETTTFPLQTATILLPVLQTTLRR